MLSARHERQAYRLTDAMPSEQRIVPREVTPVGWFLGHRRLRTGVPPVQVGIGVADVLKHLGVGQPAIVPAQHGALGEAGLPLGPNRGQAEVTDRHRTEDLRAAFAVEL